MPTSYGEEVVVRSHWNVSIKDDLPDWSRVVIIDLDVTNLRMAEHNLAQANRLEAIGAIAAGVAHELNTPLQYISDNLRFVADSMSTLMPVLEKLRHMGGSPADPDLAVSVEGCDLEFLVAEVPFALAQSLEGASAMARIVQALKEFSHGGSRQLEPTDLNRLIQTSVVVGRSEWKGIADVVLELSQSLPRVPAYGQELGQVVLNLVVNASHAIHQHKPGETGTITVSTSVIGEHAVIRVKDDGGGIPESIRERIFDPFFTTKEVGLGTGQGLAIARNIVVARHGGLLDLDVDDGIGSIFTIKIPLAA